MAKNTGNRMGRGLDSLLGGDDIQAMTEQVAEIRGSLKFAEIKIDEIHPNPNQPRKEFDEDALEAIAERAYEKDTGARALRSIVEELMLDIMYEIPKDKNIGRVVITKAYIEGTGGPTIEMRTL